MVRVEAAAIGDEAVDAVPLVRAEVVRDGLDDIERAVLVSGEVDRDAIDLFAAEGCARPSVGDQQRSDVGDRPGRERGDDVTPWFAGSGPFENVASVPLFDKAGARAGARAPVDPASHARRVIASGAWSCTLTPPMGTLHSSPTAFQFNSS